MPEERRGLSTEPVAIRGLGLAKAALAVLHRNQWVTVEQTVAEPRIRLGERARALSQNLMAPLMDNVTTARNVANNGDTV